MAKKHVFISFGTPYSEPQREFLKALLALLRKCNMEPRAVNMTEYSTENPLKVISRIMHECDAAIIVAYERTYFDSGFEKRKSAQEKSSSWCATPRRGIRSRRRWPMRSICRSSS